MEKVLTESHKEATNAVNRHDVWQSIVDHWDDILQSDISKYAGFDNILGSSLFESWMNGAKSDGVVSEDFVDKKDMQRIGKRLTIHLFDELSIVDRKSFILLFHPTAFLCEDSLVDALLFQRHQTLKRKYHGSFHPTKFEVRSK